MSIARNTTYNIAGAVVPILVSIATVPVYLDLIGLDRYGLLALFWLLVGYFNLFDFGIGRAATRRIAALVNGSAQERNCIFWTALAITGSLSVLALVLFFVIGWFALGQQHGSQDWLASEISYAFPILLLAVPIPFFQGLMQGVLTGREAFGRFNAITTLGSLLTSLVPLAVAKWISPELSYLCAATILARLIVLVLMTQAAARILPILSPEFSDREEVRNMLQFGGWLTVTNIIGPLLVFLDRFLLGRIVGPQAVGLYSVPFNLASQLWVLPTAFGSALFPRLAAAQDEESSRLFEKSVGIISDIIFPIAAIFLLFLNIGFTFWLGPIIGSKSFPIGVALIVGFCINSVAQIPFIQLQSQGNTGIIAKIHLIEIIPYLLFLFFMIDNLGAFGAAIAWSARTFVDFIALAWACHMRARFVGRILLRFGMLLILSILVLFPSVWTQALALAIALTFLCLAIVRMPQEAWSYLPFRRPIRGNKPGQD